jgi:hypothetical protein
MEERDRGGNIQFEEGDITYAGVCGKAGNTLSRKYIGV